MSELDSNNIIEKDIEEIISSQNTASNIRISSIKTSDKPEIKVIMDYESDDPAYKSSNDPASDAILNFL